MTRALFAIEADSPSELADTAGGLRAALGRAECAEGGVMDCSCGNPEPHVIAVRRTYDEKTLKVWSDGGLTWAFEAVRGVGRPKSEQSRREYLRAARLVAGDACIFTRDEIPGLFKAALASVRSGVATPGDMRRRFKAASETRLKPTWVTLQTDRDGNPTCRTWTLPRLRWPGLVVWNERGRYSLHRRGVGRARDTLFSTGIEFANQRELLAWLNANGDDLAGRVQ